MKEPPVNDVHGRREVKKERKGKETNREKYPAYRSRCTPLVNKLLERAFVLLTFHLSKPPPLPSLTSALPSP